ncbi:type II toxin-antitoxin system RelE/ParE family toxin [Chroococcidiopsis sp. CCMEE 29]|uniref:type II toxin-antitoxin system RelE/ParE family toxin n=1 Tax=Chroococcidiopsis sp. CCMEE 29 TaxID=155894 RepID=UPI00202205A3|nr:type II toxin-antitoxin system RelE/ParE family toxin [Chroococcidiopsis sp. CCMEE 29]
MTEKPRSLVWLGNSLDNLRAFPEAVQKDVGDDLQVVQWGGTPSSAKPFKSVGSGVYELVERYDTNAYRVVYAVKLGMKIYVLHAFQKKAKTGIKTPQPDVDLIRRQYDLAVKIAKQEQGK